jgi:HAD superfamily hydrolase (TIGR01509 family)
MIRWVFFDLGGTLLDDLPFHDYIYGTMLSMFAERGYDVTMDELVSMRDLLVKKRVPVLKSLIEHFTGKERLVNPLMKELMSRIEGKGPELQSPFPESQQVLEKVRERHRLGVIANQEAGIHDLLNKVGWNRMFDVIIISDEVQLWKPDARIFKMALEKAGCEPSEAVMVGDRIDNDVTPAKRLGMKTVRYRWGIFGTQEPASEEEKPDLEILSLSDLPEALERL